MESGSVPSFECSACGETKRLRGRREGDVIEIACEACGHRWTRNPWSCPQCGHEMSEVREPLLQKARGTQQSIVAYRTRRVCLRCEPPPDRSDGWMSAT